MKVSSLIFLSLILTSCATRHVPLVKTTPHAVPGTTLSSEGIESVRYAENIKAYPLARYIDPNNSRVMHEAHPVYRVETTAKWNLHTNPRVSVAAGPSARVPDTASAPAPLRDELMAELNRQKEATRTVIQGGEAISQKLGELANTVQQTKEIAEQNSHLQEEVNTTKQRLQTLEDELRKKQRAERTGEPTEEQKNDQSDW
jgi:hypothetical protein